MVQWLLNPGTSLCRKECSKVLPCGNTFVSNPLCCIFFSSINTTAQSFSSYWFFWKNFWNGRIIALQNFAVFCHTSTKISHRCTHVPSLRISLQSPSSSYSLVCLRDPVWVPWVIQKIPIGYLFYIWSCKFLCYSLQTSHLLHPLLPTCRYWLCLACILSSHLHDGQVCLHQGVVVIIITCLVPELHVSLWGWSNTCCEVFMVHENFPSWGSRFYIGVQVTMRETDFWGTMQAALGVQ